MNKDIDLEFKNLIIGNHAKEIVGHDDVEQNQTIH